MGIRKYMYCKFCGKPTPIDSELDPNSISLENIKIAIQCPYCGNYNKDYKLEKKKQKELNYFFAENERG